MQSYEHHVLYESLEMRHPYIEKPFYRDIEPDQVGKLAIDTVLNEVYLLHTTIPTFENCFQSLSFVSLLETVSHTIFVYIDHYRYIRPNDPEIQRRPP